MGVNAILDAVTAGLETKLGSLINTVYDYESITDRLQRYVVAFWLSSNPNTLQSLAQKDWAHDFVIYSAAKHDGTPATLRSAERDLNDINDMVLDWFGDNIKNPPLWKNLSMIFSPGSRDHPEIPKTKIRVYYIRVQEQ